MDIVFFAIRYTPFWAIPVIFISAYFAYTYWIKDIRIIAAGFGFIGFLAHFMIDIIIAIVLSSYWKTRRGFFTSLIVITVIWFFAFFMAEKLMGHIPPTSEGILYLASGFLLSMFIHKPHKQVLICH